MAGRSKAQKKYSRWLCRLTFFPASSSCRNRPGVICLLSFVCFFYDRREGQSPAQFIMLLHYPQEMSDVADLLEPETVVSVCLTRRSLCAGSPWIMPCPKYQRKPPCWHASARNQHLPQVHTASPYPHSQFVSTRTTSFRRTIQHTRPQADASVCSTPFHLRSDSKKPWLTFRVTSRAANATQRPCVLEGEPIVREIELQLDRAEYF
jgi:hypothetical protein